MYRPLVFVFTLMVASSAAAAEWMMHAVVDGRPLEGQPIAWTKSRVHLLGRDGALHEFHPKKARDARRTAAEFRAYSHREVRKRLRQEFGGRYEATGTSHYIVLHPPGVGGEWAARFESIYRSFLSYVRVRGFPVREPEFPLVAVVMRNEAEYQRFLRGSGARALPGILGHYDHASNRVVLYDQTSGGEDWSANAETIIHEATHQMAFNVGVHSRTATNAYWVPEGLAMLFEARGVWNPSGHDRPSDRWNAARLRDFRADLKKHDGPKFDLAEFIASDAPFRRDGTAAYAQAWALAFYLAETRPREYAQYLQTTASRPMFAKYPPVERVSDFRGAFGRDLEILEANWVRWVEALGR